MLLDVFVVDGSWCVYYKFLVVVLSLIMNCVMGVVFMGVMSVGGIIVFVGGVEVVLMMMEMFKVNVLLVVVLVKFALSFSFVFYTFGGFRYLVWDLMMKGIDNESVNVSLLVIFGVSVVVSVVLVVYMW